MSRSLCEPKKNDLNRALASDFNTPLKYVYAYTYVRTYQRIVMA